MDETTEPAQPAPVEGEASPVPDAFFWALWVGVFFVILWGMLVLFRRRTPDAP